MVTDRAHIRRSGLAVIHSPCLVCLSASDRSRSGTRGRMGGCRRGGRRGGKRSTAPTASTGAHEGPPGTSRPPHTAGWVPSSPRSSLGSPTKRAYAGRRPRVRARRAAAPPPPAAPRPRARRGRGGRAPRATCRHPSSGSAPPAAPTLPDDLRDLDALVLAHEWLDVVPCTVAEVDDDGVLREVLVDGSGAERLGDEVAADDRAWADAWWPAVTPGERVEVGLSRDLAWRDLVSRSASGLTIAVDYGHTRTGRPSHGSLTAYREGQVVEAVPDGSARPHRPRRDRLARGRRGRHPARAAAPASASPLRPRTTRGPRPTRSATCTTSAVPPPSPHSPTPTGSAGSTGRCRGILGRADLT